jgi:hypothetical protein
MGRSVLKVAAAVLLGYLTLPVFDIASAPAHPPIPEPLEVARYLEAQRAGFGSPSHTAALAGRALAQAQAIRARGSRPSVQTAGAPAPSAQSFAGAWSPIGPMPVTDSYYGSTNTGRVDSVAVVSGGTHAGEIFIGTAGGGVWSSSDGGTTWQTHTDNVSTGLAIGALAIDPMEPETIYAGTGEANNCGDCFYGGGVLKSTDGGNTWTVENPGGAFTGVDFASIVVDSKEPSTLYAGTSAGFYVSKDGGVTWAHPIGTGTFTEPTYGIALDPTSTPTTVYIASTYVGVQKSTDGAANFTTLGGLPGASEFGVTALGIGTSSGAHPKANETLYAAVQLNGGIGPGGGDLKMFKSTNAGAAWSEVTTIPAYTNQSYAYGSGSSDQASYDNAIAVDPSNPEHVIAEGIAAIETKDGATTWANINGHPSFFEGNNHIHPDFHAVTVASPTEAIIGCDGGVYEYDPATGPGSGLKSLNTNQDTTQLYEDLSVYNNGEKILGGLQDNGTAFFTGSTEWPDELSGDGGYDAINPLEPAEQFAEADERLYETTNGWTTTPTELSVGIGNEGVDGNFVPPMTIVSNPSKPTEPTVFYGGQDLWATHNPAAANPTWKKLTTAGEENTTAVSAIAVSPSDPEVMYVGFDDGILLVSTNATSATPTFTDISVPGAAQWITHIAVSPTDPGSIAVSFADGGSFNTQSSPLPPMVETGTVALTGTPPSATYTNITGNLPAGVASNSVVFDRGALVVATDVGVFSATALNGSSTAWSAVGTGLPNVQVIGLTLDAAGGLYAATHGRGVWKLPTKAPQTVSFTSTPPSAARVGGPAYTVAASSSSGLPAELSIDASSASVCSLSGSTSGSSVTFTGVGTCTIGAAQAGDSTYEPAPQVQQQFTVAKGLQTVAFTSTAPSNATVGGALYIVTASASSGLPVQLSIDVASASVCAIAGSESGSTVSFTGAGTCTIDASQAGDSNYEPASFEQQSFTVTQPHSTGGSQSGGTESMSTSPFTFSIPASEQLGNQTASQPHVPPSNVIHIVAEKQGKRPGSLVLSIEVPGPGVVSLIEPTSGHAGGKAGKHARRKAVPTLVKRVHATVTKSGIVKLQVMLTPAGEVRLKRAHKLSVKVSIAFTPTGGVTGKLPSTLAFVTKHAARRHR